MKQTTVIPLLALLGIAAGCADFLDKESKAALTEEQVYADISNITPLVDGLYTTYRNLRAGRNGLMVNLGTDETQQGNFQLNSEIAQSGLDKYNGLLNPTSPQVAAIWSSRWPLVVTAAKAVDVLGKVEATEATSVLLGEASFFRGLGMFELAMFFGEIPIIDVGRSAELGTGRQPLADVWACILNDLRKATQVLPAKQTKPKRATSGAAWAMLGKAFMCAPEETLLRSYDSAKVCFEHVMAGTYSLVPHYATLFANDRDDVPWQTNTSESIFELQFETLWPDVSYWEFDCGSRAVDATFGQGCYFSGYDFLVPTPFAYCGTIPATNSSYWKDEDTNLPFFWEGQPGLWEDGDQRRAVCLRYDFAYAQMKKTTNADGEDVVTYDTITPTLDKTSWTGTKDELQPHIRKWEDLRTDEKVGDIANMWNSGKNHPLIRLADIYLLYAECLYRLSATGADGDYRAYAMKVRTRAGLTAPLPDPYNDPIKALMDERMRELCFEGWRRVDLIRTGLFEELVSARNRWASTEHGGALIPSFYKRFPIPDDEIKTNEDMGKQGAAAQNTGYS